MAKGSIAAALAKSKAPTVPVTPPEAPATPVSTVSPVASVRSEDRRAPSRRGTRQLVAHVDPAVLRQLKILAAELDTTQAALIGTAINDLFERYGKPRLASEQAAER